MKVKKLGVKQLCIIAMLLSITAVLSCVSGGLRIGNAVKFSISFISVYVSAAVFGALWGGFVGFAADLISFVINPTGAYIWQLGALEFLYGASYGVFFHGKRNDGKRKALSVLLCVTVQLLINLFVKTYILMSLGFMPQISFAACVLARLLSCLFMAAIQFAVIYITEKKYIAGLCKMSE